MWWKNAHDACFQCGNMHLTRYMINVKLTFGKGILFSRHHPRRTYRVRYCLGCAGSLGLKGGEHFIYENRNH
jgi:hypothetical protein